jgi:hypothetical protein
VAWGCRECGETCGRCSCATSTSAVSCRGLRCASGCWTVRFPCRQGWDACYARCADSGGELWRSPEGDCAASIHWSLVFPTSVLGEACDSVCATDSFGPGSVFLPPERFRVSRVAIAVDVVTESSTSERTRIVVDLRELAHLGHNPFVPLNDGLLSHLRGDGIILSMHDGWYCAPGVIAEARANGVTVPFPAKPPRGYVPPSLVPSGTPDRRDAEAAPRVADLPVGGPGSNPASTVAFMDFRQSLETMGSLVKICSVIDQDSALICGLPEPAMEEAPMMLDEPVVPSDAKELRIARQLLASEECALEKAQDQARRLATECEEAADSLEQLLERVERAEGVRSRAAREAEVWGGLLHDDQLRLIHELSLLYPIVERDDLRKVYSIRGLLFNEHDLTKQQEENVSTALGYVAHTVMLLSRYLLVPLRFDLVCAASRSWVLDLHDPRHVKRAYPLFHRAESKTEFDTANQLLRKDVEHLLLSQGLRVYPDLPLLGNLRNLFHALLHPVAEEILSPTSRPREFDDASSVAAGWQ